MNRLTKKLAVFGAVVAFGVTSLGVGAADAHIVPGVRCARVWWDFDDISAKNCDTRRTIKLLVDCRWDGKGFQTVWVPPLATRSKHCTFGISDWHLQNP